MKSPLDNEFTPAHTFLLEHARRLIHAAPRGKPVHRGGPHPLRPGAHEASLK